MSIQQRTIDDGESSVGACLDQRLVNRVLGEFREMPSLTLTIDQACRMWGLDRTTCNSVVKELVGRRLLQWSEGGRLIRAASCR